MCSVYFLRDLNDRAVRDPEGFVAESEAAYDRRIRDAAARLREALPARPILLLSGPSSVGKTTTADRLCRALEGLGVGARRLSMDDYFLSRGSYSMPFDAENGVPDLESPLCMDLPLLGDHLRRLAAGEEIALPRFDFLTGQQTRDVTPIRRRPDELIIIEGIHALNDVITGGLDGLATGVSLALDASVVCDDGLRFSPETLRFARRALRDARFRGASVPDTIRQWRSVRRGERLYIAPYRHAAAFTLDTYLPYESCVLYPALAEALTRNADALRQAGLPEAVEAARRFAPLDPAPFLPADSLLREFFG